MSGSTPVKMMITAWFSADEAARGNYLQGSEQIFKAHGMIGATVYTTDASLLGDFAPHVVVMLDWKDADGCKAALESAEYAALLDDRAKAFDKLTMTLLGAQ